jgi:hypothetical protein
MFVKRVMQRNKLGRISEKIDGHAGVRDLPFDLVEGHSLFGVARPPRSWYESLHRHYRNRKGGVEGFLLHSLGPGRHSFEHVVHCVTEPSASMVRDREVRYPGSRGRPIPLFWQLHHHGIGLWSWMMLRMFTRGSVERLEPSELDWGVDTLVDHRMLREGLLLVLEEHVEVSDALRAQVGHDKPLNVGQYRNDRIDWTPEMIDRVARADGWLAEHLGLAESTDPFALDPQPVNTPLIRLSA